jgi:hypothetical protein
MEYGIGHEKSVCVIRESLSLNTQQEKSIRESLSLNTQQEVSNDLNCLLQSGYYLNGTKLGLSFLTQKSQGKCKVSSLKEKMK